MTSEIEEYGFGDPHRCPKCGRKTVVVDSRTMADAHRRRRACARCNTRFTTYETVIPPHSKMNREVIQAVGYLRKAVEHLSNTGLIEEITIEVDDSRPFPKARKDRAGSAI